ncbi:MAG: MarR family winged helix-turn-helix transcriptional regulator [Ktedonobacteraceae bacterium]
MMREQIDSSALGNCVCANIRRTDRVVTAFYDEMLAPSGLSAPQFGLLSTLAAVAPITINGLAEVLGIDRTTLTRNLDVLMKQHLVQSREGKDRRIRLVLPTREGEEALKVAMPLWQEAQARIERVPGSERLGELLAELAAVRASAT